MRGRAVPLHPGIYRVPPPGCGFTLVFVPDAKAIRYRMNILIHDRIGPKFEKIYHEHVFSYENHHSCEGAFVSLTEQWKHSIDEINVRQWLVSMDLTKVSDSLPQEQIKGQLSYMMRDFIMKCRIWMRGIITRASNIELVNSFTSGDQLTGRE